MKKSLIVAALCSLIALGVTAREIKEVAIIGNSIRKHGKAPQIGWNYDWGMAATSEDKDYAHVLYRKICDKLAATQKEAPKLSMPGGVVERDWSKWDPNAAKSADVLIIQLGDNFRKKQDFDAQRDFIDLYAKMVSEMKVANPDQIVICTSNWGGGEMVGWLKEAAGKAGALFVDIGVLSKNPENLAKSEGNFTHGGVNWHPGNRGMAAIADAIFKVLEPELDKKIAE